MTNQPKLKYACPMQINEFEKMGDNQYWCKSCEEHVHDFRNISFEAHQKFKEKSAREICGIYNTDENGRIFFFQNAEHISLFKVAAFAILICFNSALFSMSPMQHHRLEELNGVWMNVHHSDDSVTVKVRIKVNKQRLRNKSLLVKINDAKDFQTMATDEDGHLMLLLSKTDQLKNVIINLDEKHAPIEFSLDGDAGEISKKLVRIDLEYPNARGRF